MVRRRGIFGGLFSGVFLSTLLHAGTVGGLYFLFVKQEAPIVAELDLSMATLSPMVPNAGGGRGRRAEEWFLPPKDKKAPIPVSPPPVEAKKEEPMPVEEEESLPCPEPCVETEGDGSGGGGTGEGRGFYVPASETTRKPRWVGNFITSADYPLLAKQNGKDGRVVLQVFIDETGIVRDVRLLQGAYDALNEVALRKAREAKFTPAYDDKRHAVACQVVLPIRFELR